SFVRTAIALVVFEDGSECCIQRYSLSPGEEPHRAEGELWADLTVVEGSIARDRQFESGFLQQRVIQTPITLTILNPDQTDNFETDVEMARRRQRAAHHGWARGIDALSARARFLHRARWLAICFRYAMRALRSVSGSMLGGNAGIRLPFSW